MNELADLLARPKVDRYISLEDRQQFLRLLGRLSELVPIVNRATPAATPVMINFSRSR